MLLCRRVKRIEPTKIAEIKKKVPPGKRVGQSQWDDDAPGIESMCDFSLNMRRCIGIFREQEDHHTTGPDGVPRGLRPIFACRDVSSGNPASYPGRLKLFADCVRDALILMCMTDK